MNSRLPSIAMILCTLSYAFAGTAAIGTASARGDMRVDGYMVKGDATLFEGTVVQTGQASAALRMEKGVEIKLATDSRGTLFRDRLVLQQGSSEWTPSSSFQVEANGLRVTPNEPNSRGQVSLGKSNTVEVAALTGGFQVTNNRGLLLARVSPGHTLSFGVLEGAAPDSTSISVSGTLSTEGGLYFVTVAETGVVFQVTGKNFSKWVGMEVSITGTIDPNAKPANGASSVVVVSSASKNKDNGSAGESSGMSNGKKAIIGALILGGAAGIGIGTYEANQNTPPASK